MMKFAVCYLVSGAAHLPYLLVSARSLRQHWDGDIFIYAWPESYDIAKLIASDPTVCATCIAIAPIRRSKLIGGQPFDRILIMRDGSNKDVGLYLDCDTIVQHPVMPLLETAAHYGFVFTQFCDWVSTGKTIRKRIDRMIGIDEIPQAAVLNATKWSMPSVNTGVFACVPDSRVLAEWYRYVLAAENLFIGDEISAHAIVSRYLNEKSRIRVWGHFIHALASRKSKVAVAMGGMWNCSPKYRPELLPLWNVRIWHGHGDCFTRPSKSEFGTDMWWSLFTEAMEENAGGVQEWIGSVGHGYLQQLMEERWAQ